jgi:ribulose-phosphate 3-epimerase
LIDRIKKEGIQAGISLNPATPVSALKHVLPLVDLVLLMTVDPGFYGQSYIPTMTEKIRELDLMRKEQGLSFRIETDGGIDAETVKPLLGMIDMTVLGKAFFKNPCLEDLLKILGYGIKEER